MKTVTQWFSGKPERIGVWETEYPFRPNRRIYQYWDGSKFYAYAGDVESAKLCFTLKEVSLYQNYRHRGLADKPAEGSAS